MSTTRRLNVEVVGSASGFLAMMNRVTSGMTRFGSGLGTLNRNAQQSNRWLQAMSTTLRYAFAGRVIFGIQNAVNNLAEFKTQLGEIDALAGRITDQGKFQGLGSQLDVLGKQALLMSNRFGVAVPEVEAYMQRFYTSFQPKGSPKQQAKEMTDFVNAHLELVTMLGSRAGDPNALAGGLAGLIRAMPGGEKRAGKNAQILTNYFARVVTSTPNLTGQDIASAAGRLASAKTLSGMSVRDILGVYGLAAQTGGSAAIITRGVTQLLGSSLLHPTRPQSLNLYRQIGLPTDPNQLRALGGTKVLERLMQFSAAGAVPGDPTGKKNLNLNAIYNAFSRQESVRQFVNLLANGGVPKLKEFIASLDKTAQANVVHQRAQARLDQSLLIRMQRASTNLGIALTQGANPVLENLVARPIIGLSNLAIRHPNAVQGIEAGAFTLGAANALRRLGAFNKLGGLGRFGRFVSGASAIEQQAIGGAISKEELPAAIAGGATDGTRGNPFWVIIAPLSWQLGQPGGAFGPQADKPGGPSLFGRAKGLIRKFPVIPVVGAAGVAADVAPPVAGLGLGFAFGKYVIGKGESWKDLRKRGFTQNQILTMRESVPAAYRSPLLNALQAGQVGPQQVQTIKFEGNPKADLTIKLVDAQGRTISIQEHKGVPILPKAKTFPSSQGKAKARKGAT